MTSAYAKDLEHGLELPERHDRPGAQAPSELRASFEHGLSEASLHSRLGSQETVIPEVEKDLDSRIITSSVTTSYPSHEDDFYPEGGWAAYSVVFGSFCGMVAGFGLMNTVGTFQTYLTMHQLAHYSESEVGWIFSLYTFFAFFCGVQIGPVFDAKGPRWLIFAGSVSLVVGLLGIANSTGKRSREQIYLRPRQAC